MTETQALALFKCLADRSRLQILKSLAIEDMHVERLAQRLDLTPPTVSFHLKKLSEAFRMLKVFCQPNAVQIGTYHQIRKLFCNKPSEFHCQPDLNSHIPQYGVVIIDDQSAVIAGCGTAQSYLFGYQIHALWGPGRTQDDRNIPALQILQMALRAGHDLVLGVEQRSVNVQKNSRICTHLIAPPRSSSCP